MDLPGYGFAKAPIDDIKKWKKLIESYYFKSKFIFKREENVSYLYLYILRGENNE